MESILLWIYLSRFFCSCFEPTVQEATDEAEQHPLDEDEE